MTRMIGILALAAAGLVGCQNAGMNNSSAATNDNDPRAVTLQSDKMPTLRAMTDQQFVNAAGAGGIYEVQEGRIAQSKGESDNVKMIGQHMVADHTKANDTLTGIAQQLNLSMPSAPTEEQQGMISKLNNLSGSDFDKEYLMQQETAHRETIAMFESEAKGGNSRQLRQFAADTLPTLRLHLAMITGKHEDVNLGSER